MPTEKQIREADLAYWNWLREDYHFTLNCGCSENLTILDNTGKPVATAIVNELRTPAQQLRKGYISHFIIGNKIKFINVNKIVQPEYFAEVIQDFVSGKEPQLFYTAEITLDGESFNWRQESDKYLYG
jgi:hypothetical protein